MNEIRTLSETYYDQRRKLIKSFVLDNYKKTIRRNRRQNDWEDLENNYRVYNWPDSVPMNPKFVGGKYAGKQRDYTLNEINLILDNLDKIQIVKKTDYA